ncbi:hypothetical protein ABN028_20910 [Actinopolymorpha sp. B17G11]|uniref:hypothetical protein n=1 Tax=unclassified Actinopolymorpha TaxID=2627063 RepID=UPI0032D92982
MRRSAAVMCALGLALGALVACGGQDAAYCDVLTEGVDLASADPSDDKGFTALSKQLDKAADAAPDEIKEHWVTLSTTMKATRQAMDDPGNADKAQLEQNRQAAEEAVNAVSVDAKQRCNLEVS